MRVAQLPIMAGPPWRVSGQAIGWDGPRPSIGSVCRRQSLCPPAETQRSGPQAAHAFPSPLPNRPPHRRSAHRARLQRHPVVLGLEIRHQHREAGLLARRL